MIISPASRLLRLLTVFRRLVPVLAGLMFASSASAQAPFAGSYSQNFDGMGTGTAPPTGWTTHVIGTSSTGWATSIPASGTTSAATAGTSNAAVVRQDDPGASVSSSTQGYNFGVTAGGRSLGTSPTGVNGTALQLRLTNNTGGALASLRVAYDIHRFRNGSTANSLPGYWLFYSLDNGSTWTSVAALNPTISGPTGVVVPNTVGITSVPTTTITLASSFVAGGEIRFRWIDDNASESSPDQIVGLDNLVIDLSQPAPTVTLTAPGEGASFALPTTIALEATAADSNGSVSKVEFFAASTKLGEDLDSPYTYTWSGMISGAYALTAKATDDDGAATTSAAVNITITNPSNVAPSVTLTAPANGTQIAGNATTLTATASDSDGIVAKVEFYNGATKLGEDTSLPYSYNWTGVATGSYSVTARAIDNDGAVTNSAAASVTFVVPVENTTITRRPAGQPGATWKYLDNGSDQGTAWKESAFDDSAWVSGAAPLGYNDSHIQTTINSGPTNDRIITTYLRRTFDITGVGAVQSIKLNVLRDDGVVIYINGVEVARQNMPAGTISYLTNSSSIVSGSDETTYFLSTVSTLPLLNEGSNVVAVELHNRDNTSSDLGFDLELVTVSLPGTPPTVDLTGPVDGASFTAPASVNLTANAADSDGTIAKVEFFQGATKLGEDTEAPYTFNWSMVAQGGYDLTAKATDNYGLTTTSAAVTIAVGPPNTVFPSVTLTGPANNASFIAPGTVAITADAADSDGTVTKVEFFEGSNKLGEDTLAPYTFSWANVPVGTYTLTARATDNLTAATTSASVTVIVAPNLPASITLATPLDAATGLGGAGRVNLAATVSDPEGQPLAVTFYGRPKSSPPGEDFSLVAIPDTQFYSENVGGNRIQLFESQTNWIVNSRQSLNTAFVAHMGDMTQSYNGSEAEFIRADGAMDIIENPLTTLLAHGIPWGGAPGNHDIGSGGNTSFWNQYFGVSRWAGRPYFGGGYTNNTTDQNYHLFSAGGMDFIIINLAYNSSTSGNQAVMDWADALLKAHPDRRGIITSHWLISTGNPASWGGHGQAVYDNLKDNPNLFLMLCGHIHGEGRRADVFEGRTVNTVLQDYQSRANGGDSWLRYFTFKPAENKIYAYTYKANTAPVGSPLGGTFETDADSQFTLDYNMASVAPWTPLGTVNLTSGESTATLPWTGLVSGEEYEWYAAVSDGVTPVGSATRAFTASGNAFPSITLTAPSDGAMLTRPATVDFAASASDLDGDVAKVEFYEGTTKVGEDATAPYTFSWDAPSGTYSVSAKSIDGEGASTDSATALVTVRFDLTPTVTGGSNSGIVTGGSGVVAGSNAIFVATANPGFVFSGWSVDGVPAGSDATLDIPVTGATAVEAIFVRALLITEVQSSQASAGRNDYWELTNISLQPIDLSAWKWDDDSANPNDAAAVTIPPGTTLTPGESILFSALPAVDLRTWWGLASTVQVVTGGPGLGSGDAVVLFNPAGSEVTRLSYAANGFTRTDNTPSLGGQAGLSAGGSTATQTLIWDPAHGTVNPRYEAATAGINGAFVSTENVADIGSPGYNGWVAPIQLLITEVQSSQAQAGRNDFWELTNVGIQSVDLGNWKWDDDSRTPADAAAVTIPAGTMIAPGESIVFTGLAAATFRTWWGIAPTVQVISTGAAPGLGQNDALALFDTNGMERAFFRYAAGAFTLSGGGPSIGGHAGASAGGSATASAVFAPAFGTIAPRYTVAAAGVAGAFASAENAGDVGSPGFSGYTTVQGPMIDLTLSAIPTSFPESENNPASVGTITRATGEATELVVSLSSSDTTEATVPATVTIPANETSAAFDITAVDDTFPDGSQTVTISATATGATPTTLDLTVQDDGDTIAVEFLLTEIQSNQSALKPTGANDYWELTNISAGTKDISGYSWHDSGRSGASSSAYKLPPATTIAAGESIIFTSMPAADFRAWWNLPLTVQVFQSVGAPGLGQGDGISFFDSGQNELFFFDYAAPSAGPPVRLGFVREDGSPSTGGHAGPSGGGSADSQALIWVPSSGTVTPRYTAATGSNLGTFSAVAPATDLGSPGVGNVRTVSLSNNSVLEGNGGTTTLSLTVTRSDIATAFTADYAVTGGTAVSGTDYAALASGTLTFTNGGSATQIIDISINGDTAAEPDETIILTLSNVVNTVGDTLIGTSTGTGTILNDDTISPMLTLRVGGSTIATGGVTTLRVAATGNPAPGLQWYQGVKGDISNPVGGATFPTLLTGPLAGSTNFWVRASNTGGDFDSDTITVNVVPAITSVDLSNYVRVGRHGLPEPLLTALPAGTPVHNLLCQEASGVTYNPDTDTLFVVADGGRSVTQVSKTGVLIDTMTLALGASPQGTTFYDIEGITYIGGGEFVMSEERDRQLVKFTYVAGTTLTRAATQTVKIGTFVDNTGTEGLSYDPLTSGYVVLKEISPIGIFQTTVDFAAGTASNGSAAMVNSTDLFDPALLGMTDVADVFALSVLPSMAGQPQQSNLLVLSQEDGKLVNIDRAGVISSTRQIFSDPGNLLSVAGQQHEGVTMDAAGFLYIVNENGGGGIDFPELWVYAPATAPNVAPTSLSVNGAVTSVIENSSTASPVRLGEIVVIDDGLGTNVLSLAGADAAFFELVGNTLFLKANTVLDFETKTSYAVTLQVDDASLGGTPDATASFTLTVIDQDPETPPPPALLITEVAPWSSGNSPVAADWFEVTNISPDAIDLAGYKVDDSSKAFGSAVDLTGITSIAPGESVIFIETSDLAGKSAQFLSHWYGSTPPVALQIGSYSGSGIGFGTSGDAVWLFDSAGQVRTGITFGASPSGPRFATFDNTAGLNAVAVSKLSALGVNGALAAAGSPNEIGSPGFAAPGLLRITEVAPWSSGNSPVGADWFEVTNVGARVVSLAAWKIDDSSESPLGGAVALNGVAAIAPGESVIFLETENVATTVSAFLSNWFGANPPSGLQVGTYSGSGVGLSTGGDAVNLFDAANVRQAKVTFGASPASAPFGTFDNSAFIDNAAITLSSVAGVNGAVVATNSAIEVGSPGLLSVAITPSVTGGSGGSVTGGGSLPLGSAAVFTAIPSSGYEFLRWIVNGVPSSETTTILNLAVTVGLTVEAEFAYIPFTLQLLHLSDGEAGLLASQTAPNLAAIADGFDGQYANTLILSGGDNFIPSPFLNAGTDPSLNAISSVGRTNFARPDIAIHNLIGVEASAIGNHEWDLGSNVFMDAIRPDNAWVGAQFPHLSANLDFSLDSAANGRFTNVPLDGVTTAVPEASTLKSRLVPTAVITKGGEKIGLLGVTTQILRSISSPSGTFAKGFPVGTTGVDDMDLLATQIQPYINELIAEGVNKIVLLSHLQQIANEQLLATKISGVDIILAAGSNTRLGDGDDLAVAFPGHAATFAGAYPIVTAGTDGKPTLIVNTDNEYTYLGRLVIDFDGNGEVILADLPTRAPLNGAYAATIENVAAAWGVPANQLATTAFAAGTKGSAVKEITDAVQSVINAKDGDVKGYTSVYLEGERNFVRSEETNFGNLSSDANAEFARAILNDGVPVVSLKNGGGIRAQIGAIAVGSGAKLPPVANPTVGKLEGGISQLDIENALRFNNRLMVFDTSPQGLKNILEHGVAAGVLQGRFPQIGGVSFAWDPSLPVGSRVTTISLIGEAGQLQFALYDGAFSPWAPPVIRLVTLNFLAGNTTSPDGLASGGDGYPMRANGSDFRFLLADGTLGPILDPTLNFTAAPALPTNPLGEQQAFADFLGERYATPATAYDVADTTAAEDLRIQNLSLRSDEVPFDFSLTLGGSGVGSLGNVSLESGERQGFRFTLGERRLVTLSGTGAAGLAAELLDENGNVVGTFDETGELLIGALLEAGDYLLRVLNAGETDETLSLTIDAGTVPATRPDVAVGTSLGALRGVGVYSVPASQAISLRSKKLRPVQAIVTVANRGTLPDAMKIRATRGNRDFRVVYTSGGSNITAALVADTFDSGVRSDTDAPLLVTATISPNKNRLMTTRRILSDKPRFSATSVARSGGGVFDEEFIGESKRVRIETKILKRTYSTQIRATSVSNPSISDGAQIRVTTK